MLFLPLFHGDEGLGEVDDLTVDDVVTDDEDWYAGVRVVQIADKLALNILVAMTGFQIALKAKTFERC